MCLRAKFITAHNWGKHSAFIQSDLNGRGASENPLLLEHKEMQHCNGSVLCMVDGWSPWKYNHFRLWRSETGNAKSRGCQPVD